MKKKEMLVHKIEKGIPTPKKYIHEKWKILFHEMKVGDSILLPVEEARAFIGSIYHHHGKDKFRSISRTNNSGEIRVWKILKDSA